MSPTGPDSSSQGITAWTYPENPVARKVELIAKAGFLLIDGKTFAYRYKESTEQLTITNCDGAAVFPVLSGDDARVALDTIQNLPNA